MGWCFQYRWQWNYGSGAHVPIDSSVDSEDGGWRSRHCRAGSHLYPSPNLSPSPSALRYFRRMHVVKAAPRWMLENQLSWEQESFDSQLGTKRQDLGVYLRHKCKLHGYRDGEERWYMQLWKGIVSPCESHPSLSCLSLNKSSVDLKWLHRSSKMTV